MMKSIKHKGIRETYWYVPDPMLGKPTNGNLGSYKWHRENGPAFIGKYSVEYWFHDNWHRYDGPAYIVKHSGDKKTFDLVWYLFGNEVDGDDYKQWLIDMGMDIKNLTPEDKVLIDLKWKPQ